MAARTATVRGVQLLRGDDDAVGAESANFKTKNYAISIDPNGTVVTAGSDTLNCAIDTAITGNNREGKTVTLRSACLMKCGYTASSSTSYAASMTLSGNSVVLTILQSDWATGQTIAASAVLDRPLVVMVTVNEA